MYTIDNKFEIGEECWSVYRKSANISCECPVCKGTGKFMFDGYEIPCKQCNGSGSMNIENGYIWAPCKVKIKGIKININAYNSTFHYRIDSLDNYVGVRNRSSNTMFKTFEEAQEYCRKCNTKEITAPF